MRRIDRPCAHPRLVRRSSRNCNRKIAMHLNERDFDRSYWSNLFALLDIAGSPHANFVFLHAITESLEFANLEIRVTAVIDESGVVPAHSLTPGQET